jgi:hypothetical protein
MRLVALEDERVARMSGAPFDSIRRQLGATRCDIRGVHPHIASGRAFGGLAGASNSFLGSARVEG